MHTELSLPTSDRAAPPAGRGAASSSIALTVNGESCAVDVEPRVSLLDALREHLGLTGTHLGCEHGVCGACTVLVDGREVRACLLLAVQVDGASVDTVEGLSRNGELTALQAAFRECHALQCGFCTPGILMAAADLLERDAQPTRADIEDLLSGHLCRCTGYEPIVAAIAKAAEAR